MKTDLVQTLTHSFEGRQVIDDFVDVNRMVDLGSGGRREVDDLMLTRYPRDTLLQRGIRPESLPVAEDVKKLERRLVAQDKQILKKPDALDS